MAATAISLIGILPLLAAGYIFNAIWYYTRFRLSKADGQRLFFACAISGMLIGAIAFPVCSLVREHLDLVPRNSGNELLQVARWIQASIPFPYVTTYLVAMGIAVVAGHLFNIYLFFRKTFKSPGDSRRVSVWAYWRCMPESISALDKLIRRAVMHDSLVLLCLKSRKVYCGVVSEVRGTQEATASYINIIPAFSIARNKDTLQFEWSSKTEYKAYSLKRAIDRKRSLDAEISRAQDLARAVELAARGRGFIIDEAATEAIWQPVRALKADREALERKLAEVDGDIDLSEWTKVIPVTELESLSLYKNEDHAKWFDVNPGISSDVTSDSAHPQAMRADAVN